MSKAPRLSPECHSFETHFIYPAFQFSVELVVELTDSSDGWQVNPLRILDRVRRRSRILGQRIDRPVSVEQQRNELGLAGAVELHVLGRIEAEERSGLGRELGIDFHVSGRDVEHPVKHFAARAVLDDRVDALREMKIFITPNIRVIQGVEIFYPISKL